MTKERFREKKKNTNPYRAKQYNTFQFLGTTPSMWVMCEVDDIIINEEYPTGLEPIFSIPRGYRQVEPIYEQFGKDIFLKTNKYGYNCQLCGHDIVWLYPISCSSKKIFMYVGSECVNNFMGAEYTTKTIKEYHHNMTRQKLSECVPDLVTQCNNHATGNGWLEEPYYSFRKKLYKLQENFSEFSHRKLINVLNKAKEIGLNTERTKKEIKQEARAKELRQKQIEKAYQDKLKQIMTDLKTVNAMPLPLPFTEKYFKVMVIPESADRVIYTLNHNQIEAVKNLGGFYWERVEGWVIPAPIREKI